jgi:hypothetical protein
VTRRRSERSPSSAMRSAASSSTKRTLPTGRTRHGRPRRALTQGFRSALGPRGCPPACSCARAGGAAVGAQRACRGTRPLSLRRDRSREAGQGTAQASQGAARTRVGVRRERIGGGRCGGQREPHGAEQCAEVGCAHRKTTEAVGVRRVHATSRTVTVQPAAQLGKAVRAASSAPYTTSAVPGAGPPRRPPRRRSPPKPL